MTIKRYTYYTPHWVVTTSSEEKLKQRMMVRNKKNQLKLDSMA